MSRWITITPDDLNDHKVAALVLALRTKALATGQDDPTPQFISRVVDRIRRKIASCKDNRVDDNPLAIPAGLKDMALDYIVAALKNRLEKPLTKEEADRLEVHEADLREIARCREAVESPDEPVAAPVEGGGGVDLLSSSRPIASRRQTAGL